MLAHSALETAAHGVTLVANYSTGTEVKKDGDSTIIELELQLSQVAQDVRI